jgi:predicted nucleotidyltransferase
MIRQTRGDRGPDDRSTPPAAGNGRKDDVFLGVLDAAGDALQDAGLPYLFIGGIASSVWGRQRWTHDIDLFVREMDASSALEALAGKGFDTVEEAPHWLFKAYRDDILVDLIFRSTRDILLDDEMLRRASRVEFQGRVIPLAPPEDVIVMKAIAAAEDTPRYWYDALAIIGQGELDWDYLLRRARQHGPRRILSLLLYAHSDDQLVPLEVIEDLFRAIAPERLGPVEGSA